MTTTKTAAQKAPARASDGARDAIALLKRDHKKVEKLFRRYEGLTPRATKSKREIVERIISELSMHAGIEEQVLYPTIRDNVPGGRAAVTEALSEHQQVKETLAKLGRMQPDERMDEAVRALISEVRAHVQEEEKVLFPQLRRALDRKTLETMAGLMRLAKKTAPTRPHPRSPNTPPANLVTGPVAGITDRARDAGRAVMRSRRAAKTTG